ATTSAAYQNGLLETPTVRDVSASQDLVAVGFFLASVRVGGFSQGLCTAWHSIHIRGGVQPTGRRDRFRAYHATYAGVCGNFAKQTGHCIGCAHLYAYRDRVPGSQCGGFSEREVRAFASARDIAARISTHPTHVGYILPMRDLQANPEFLRLL